MSHVACSLYSTIICPDEHMPISTDDQAVQDGVESCSSDLQVPIDFLCRPQEWGCHLLHERRLPAAVHAALHTQDAAIST